MEIVIDLEQTQSQSAEYREIVPKGEGELWVEIPRSEGRIRVSSM